MVSIMPATNAAKANSDNHAKSSIGITVRKTNDKITDKLTLKMNVNFCDCFNHFTTEPFLIDF